MTHSRQVCVYAHSISTDYHSRYSMYILRPCKSHLRRPFPTTVELPPAEHSLLTHGYMSSTHYSHTYGRRHGESGSSRPVAALINCEVQMTIVAGGLQWHVIPISPRGPHIGSRALNPSIPSPFSSFPSRTTSHPWHLSFLD